MQHDPRFHHALPGKPPGLLTRIIAVIAAVGLAIVGLMFSVVVFAIALGVGAVVAIWLWWKMRTLRKQMEQDPRFQEMRRQQQQQSGESDVIEGVVIREVHEERHERRD
ncbi:MAG: hypothetical protein LPJ91_06835 [Pseudazoarcus pumilus]|nr:hypothetical protein [Pseudazoarcus pumilus]